MAGTDSPDQFLPVPLRKGLLRRGAAAVLAAVASALLFFLAFPDYGISYLAWIAFVPLLVVIDGRTTGYAFLTGMFAGFLANTAVFFWIYEVESFRVFHGLILGAYLGLYTAIWCGVLSLFRLQSPLLPVLGASAWVLVDYLMANAGFLAFSWATLARTQTGNLPLVQIAAATGEYGVTFLVMLVNILLARALVRRSWKPVLVGAVVIAVAHAWGNWWLDATSAAPVLRVAAIQPALERRAPGTGPGTDEALAVLEELSREAADSGAELLVWPESVIYDWRAYPEIVNRVTGFVGDAGVPLLLGVSENEKFADVERDHSTAQPRRYNSAVLVMPGPEISEPYNKNLLVPFAEYTPLEGIVSWPGWLVSEILPMEPAQGYRHFSLRNDVVIAPVICWENLFADFVRRAIPEATRMLVHIVNDSWFGTSPASTQHNAASVFRAIENDTPVIVASNTGPSMIVDRRGRVLSAVDKLFAPGIAIADVVPGDGVTFYSRNGDVFVFLCALLVFAAISRRLFRPV